MITISYNEDEEMMLIEDKGKKIFYGNFWDFDDSPHGLKKFLDKLNLDVEINSDLNSIEEEEIENDDWGSEEWDE